MSSIPQPPHSNRRRLAISLVVTLMAGAWAGVTAWSIQQTRTLPLDLDGWGFLVGRMETEGRSLDVLFSTPTLWKGPVVPFVFGFAYYVAPFPESVLVLNALMLAAAVFLFHWSFCSLGAKPLPAAAALLAWVAYPPHSVVYGYYLGEPLISFFASVVFFLASRMFIRQSVATAFPTGMACAALLLARAPFAIVVAGIGILILLKFPGRRLRAIAIFTAGFAVVFAPWPVRNWIVYHEFIPFTTDGGVVLFQGTWVPGDDAIMGLSPTVSDSPGEGTLRSHAEYRELEKGEPDDPVARYRYWQALAKKQVLEDPAAQLPLLVRKSVRFWLVLNAGTWIPQWKTTAVALVCLPLALIAIVAGRRALLVQLLTVFVLGLWLFHSLIHSELRYNFPVLPMLFMLACLGFERVRDRVTGGGGGEASAT